MGPESATRTCTTSVAAGRVPVDGFAERMVFTSRLCPKGDGLDVCLITPVCDEFDANAYFRRATLVHNFRSSAYPPGFHPQLETQCWRLGSVFSSPFQW